MKKISLKGTDIWQFESLEREPFVKHFVSGRQACYLANSINAAGTEGEGATESINEHPETKGREFTLSYTAAPDREEIRANRSFLAAVLGVEENRLYFPSQVHKTRVVNVSSSASPTGLQETDALITNEIGVGIAVLAADCVPILLYDRKNKAAGAVHSGWRGTVAKILEKTLQEMNRAFGTKGEDLLACIGPSVCQDSYEVGEEVVIRFKEAFGDESGLLIPLPDNKAKADLWQANVRQLLAFGVSEQQIEVSGLCTVKNNHHFFSARRGDSGRFAAGIALK